jgi:predicted oxidoreductase (fatty acid repression mutant protein)
MEEFIMSKNFEIAVAERRTYYGISKEAVISDESLKEIVEHSVKHAPTAFNSQGSRVVVLLGEKHDRLWNITEDALRKVVPADQFASTEEKITSFRNGYGTILYFEDENVVKGLQEQFPLYKDNFPVWAQQSNGMLQYIIWTAIEAEGYGASLQHYNELIEADVKAEWKLPDNWKLIGQMPFGKPVNLPQEKVYQPIESRVQFVK